MLDRQSLKGNQETRAVWRREFSSERTRWEIIARSGFTRGRVLPIISCANHTLLMNLISRITLTLTLSLSLCTSALAGKEDGRLDIYWIDVEGGAATLMVTPAGETILVDTGLPKDRHIQRMKDCVTKTAGLRQIDHLIISHYDGDHYGGAEGLSKLVPVINLYDNGKFVGMRNHPGEGYFNLSCEKRHVVDPGETIPLKQVAGMKLGLKCLATRRQFIEAPEGAVPNPVVDCEDVPLKDPDLSENANSMVLLLEFGDFQFFNATDLTWNLETKLVCPVNLVGEVDVYQVTHHGLDRSNHPYIIRSLKPTVSVMNNGRTKGCAPEVFANLKNQPSIQAMYQVHKNQRPDGNVNNTDDRRIANTEDGRSGNHVKLSVAPDGKSYTVAIPATGHEETFKTK